ncbi:MAG: hypothetical protein IT458_12785 [Planctomycetes bacterium]|nr:hypothetical protein [Planctomycetota bacterium]
MRAFIRAPLLCAALAAASLGAKALQAQQQPAAPGLPPGVLALAGGVPLPEVQRLLLSFLEPLPEAVRDLAAPAVLALQLGARVATGLSLEELLGTVGGREWALAVLPAAGRPELVLAARPGGARGIEDLLGRLRERAAARWEGEAILIARNETVLGALPPHAAAAWLAAARPGDGEALTLHVDLDRLERERHGYRNLDAGGRLLLGPWVAAVEAARTLRVVLRVDGESVRATAHVDASPLRADLPIRHVLAAGVATRSVPAPAPEAALGLDLDRDLRSFFGHLDTIVRAEDLAGARGALSTLDLFFGGRSFLDAVLPGLGAFPSLQVLPPEDPADGGDAPRPRLRIPAFVSVWPAREEGMLEPLARAFHGLLLVAGAERVQRGERAFQVRAEAERDGIRGHAASLPPWRGVGLPPSGQDVQPTLVGGEGVVVLASATGAARAAARAARDLPPVELAGDRLWLRGAPVAAWLEEHVAVLAVQRALDEGERLPQATRVLRALAAALNMVQRAELRARALPEGGSALELEVRRARS